MSTQTIGSPARRERGLGYALAGGLAVTLIAILIGGALFTWLLLAARGPAAPELLPADTQFYAALAPNAGGVVEVQQLQAALRENFGVSDPAALLAPIERRLGVSIGDHVVTWLGSEMIVAVRGFAPPAGASPDATALLRDGEVIWLFGSKNDPQAEGFLQEHRAAREAAGERIVTREVGETTIYIAEGEDPGPLTAFALIDHYVVFSNRPEALVAMTLAEGGAGSLATVPGFERFREQLVPGRPGAVYTDGSAAAEAARAALRELLQGL
ncbi:MAG: DUF3352 domain-containing protein [Chloroflexi bacterium OHK40]